MVRADAGARGPPGAVGDERRLGTLDEAGKELVDGEDLEQQAGRVDGRAVAEVDGRRGRGREEGVGAAGTVVRAREDTRVSLSAGRTGGKEEGWRDARLDELEPEREVGRVAVPAEHDVDGRAHDGPCEPDKGRLAACAVLAQRTGRRCGLERACLAPEADGEVDSLANDGVGRARPREKVGLVGRADREERRAERVGRGRRVARG